MKWNFLPAEFVKELRTSTKGRDKLREDVNSKYGLPSAQKSERILNIEQLNWAMTLEELIPSNNQNQVGTPIDKDELNDDVDAILGFESRVKLHEIEESLNRATPRL